MTDPLAFTAKLKIIGINPYVSIPRGILSKLFKQADKSKGFITVKGTINGGDYKQTLLKSRGQWRLYTNYYSKPYLLMLKFTGIRNPYLFS